MAKAIGIFRGCSRLEYRNQAIKLLRAFEGEVTRSSYRRLWLGDDVLSILEKEKPVISYAVFVDEGMQAALPVRELLITGHQFDEATDSLHLTFEVGRFLETMLDFTPKLAEWAGATDATPPNRFVTVWDDRWPTLRAIPSSQNSQRWREAIDFLTSGWNMQECAFVRLAGAVAEVTPNGPIAAASRDGEQLLRIDSYNPHLSAAALKEKHLRVAHAGGLANITRGQGSRLQRDGSIEIGIECLTPGSLDLSVTVEPDSQFSTYLPITLDVSQGEHAGQAPPRVLGREWEQFLDGLEVHLRSDSPLYRTVLDLIVSVFPDDPAVLFHRGRLLHDLGDLSAAQRDLETALEIRSDARTLAWDLYTTLRRGETSRIRDLLDRLNMSDPTLFDELLVVAADLPEHVAMALVRAASDVFTHENELRLVRAAAPVVTSEALVVEMADAFDALDAVDDALSLLRGRMAGHRTWHAAQRRFLELSDANGERDPFVEDLAEEFLTYAGEPPAAFMDRWRRFEDYVHPAVRQRLASENASMLFDQGAEGAPAGLESALRSAELAYHRGELLEAQHALTLVEVNGDRDDDEHRVWIDQASSLRDRLADSFERLRPLDEGSDAYIAQMYADLRVWTEAKTLVVVGGRRMSPRTDEWKRELRLKRLQWLTSSVANGVDESKIMAHDPSDLVVVAIWTHMGHMKPATIDWIKRNHVPLIWAREGQRSFLEGLRQYFPDVQTGYDVDADTP